MALAVFAALLLVGCGSESTEAPRGPFDYAAMKRFDGFPVYWLGRSFDRFPITSLEDPRKQLAYNRSVGHRTYVSVDYGDCELRRAREGVLHR